MAPYDTLGQRLPSCCGPSPWQDIIWTLRRYSLTTLSLACFGSQTLAPIRDTGRYHHPQSHLSGHFFAPPLSAVRLILLSGMPLHTSPEPFKDLQVVHKEEVGDGAPMVGTYYTTHYEDSSATVTTNNSGDGKSPWNSSTLKAYGLHFGASLCPDFQASPPVPHHLQYGSCH